MSNVARPPARGGGGRRGGTGGAGDAVGGAQHLGLLGRQRRADVGHGREDLLGGEPLEAVGLEEVGGALRQLGLGLFAAEEVEEGVDDAHGRLSLVVLFVPRPLGRPCARKLRRPGPSHMGDHPMSAGVWRGSSPVRPMPPRAVAPAGAGATCGVRSGSAAEGGTRRVRGCRCRRCRGRRPWSRRPSCPRRCCRPSCRTSR